MDGFLNDLRAGMRQFAAKPGFAAAAILTLALGIGANTAVFSFLSGYLLKPLPYPHATELAQVTANFPKHRTEPLPRVSLPFYRAIKKQADAFAATAFYITGTSTVATAGRAKHVFSVYSSASLFHVLGVQPLLGRTFSAENMHAGSDDVAVISYGLWRGNFGADPGVIGKKVKFDDGVRRIIGVMPQGFAFPDRSVELWLPRTITPANFAPTTNSALNFNVHFIGRLKTGVSLGAAKVQVQHAISTYLRDKVPAKARKNVLGPGFAMGIRSWRQGLLGDRPATLWLLQGAVLLILFITCVNVANLLLSRILGRSHEMAMRSTLGATRILLARQLLGEALCLTVPGGLAGVAVAWAALHFLTGLSLGAGDSIFSISLDWRVGLFALGAVMFTAVLVSVLPISHLAKVDLQLVLQEGSRTSGGGRRARRTRNALVVAELTLATGLLAIAGLLLHSFMNLQNVDPGFRKDHVLIANLLVPQTDSRKELSSFYTSLIQRVDALPGVRQAAKTQILPMDGNRSRTIFSIVGGVPPVSGKSPVAKINRVSPGFFKTLGIPILRGQQFDARAASTPAAIIDAGVAEKYFGDADPIGRQLDVGPPGGMKFTILGVVPSIKYGKLSASAQSATIYLNDTHMPSIVTTLVVRTALPPGALIKPLRNLIASVDPNVAVYNVHTMHEQLADSLRDKQTTMTLLLAFGGIALALAIVGVYAVMSYAVGQRRAECGVRLALGAQPEDLSWLILKDGLRLLAIGLVAGLGLAVLSGYLLSAQLFGVAPFDPVTLIGSAFVLCVITLIACWLPARRAAKLDPVVALQD